MGATGTLPAQAADHHQTDARPTSARLAWMPDRPSCDAFLPPTWWVIRAHGCHIYRRPRATTRPPSAAGSSLQGKAVPQCVLEPGVVTLVVSDSSDGMALNERGRCANGAMDSEYAAPAHRSSVGVLHVDRRNVMSLGGLAVVVIANGVYERQQPALGAQLIDAHNRAAPGKAFRKCLHVGVVLDHAACACGQCAPT